MTERSFYENSEKLVSQSKSFCKRLSLRWESCNRNRRLFESRHSFWLNSISVINLNRKKVTTVGRPSKEYNIKSSRAQRRQAAHLAISEGGNISLLLLAASMAARKKGKFDLAVIFNSMTKGQIYYLIIKELRTKNGIVVHMTLLCLRRKQKYHFKTYLPIQLPDSSVYKKMLLLM